MDKETNHGKCDFSYKLRIEEAPSVELREWLREDVLIELHESRPKIVSKKSTEDESVTVKDVDIDEDGQPVIEEELLGLLRLEASKLIQNVDLQQQDLDYHKFNRFYSPSFITKPEFIYKNHLTSLKDKELELLEEALAKSEDNKREEALAS